MHDEPLIFIGDGDALCEASLLFLPRRIDAVRNHASGVVYEEGADYTVHVASGRLTRPPTSRMPCVPLHALATDDGRFMHQRLVSVTYAHDAPAPMPPPSPALRAALERTHTRLGRGEPVTICLVGDSISEGYDASGFHAVPPHQPPYASLVATSLEQHHGGPVRLHNLAVAGGSAADGRWLTAETAATEPDLVVVAYGMNDAGWADAGEFVANVSAIASDVRRARPQAEVLLVASMRPTPLCHWVVAERFSQYRDALIDLAARAGVGVADVTTAWDLLLSRKSPFDLTANGLNHPNDFGHRIHAQTILACLPPHLPRT